MTMTELIQKMSCSQNLGMLKLERAAGLGTISARRTGTDDDITELTFVPNAGIGVSITTFMNALRPEENTSLLPSELQEKLVERR